MFRRVRPLRSNLLALTRLALVLGTADCFESPSNGSSYCQSNPGNCDTSGPPTGP